MKIYLKYLLFFLLMSCSKNKNNIVNIREANQKKQTIPKTSLGNVVFIISNEMKSVPISIYRNTFTYNLNDLRHLISTKKTDTLSITVKNKEEIYVSTPFIIRDTLYVKNNDTIHLKLKNKVLSIQKKERFYLKTKTYKSKLSDSLYHEYIITQYDKPFRLKPIKYEKIRPLYPLKINRNKFEKDTISILKIANLYIDKYNSINKEFTSLKIQKPNKKEYIELYLENLNYKLLVDLNILLNYSKSTKLKQIIKSRLFYNQNTHNESKVYQKLLFFIRNIILNGKFIKTKSKRKLDLKKAFTLLPKYLNDTNLLNLSRLVCINEAIRQKDSNKMIKQLINQFEKDNNNTLYKDYIIKIKKDLSISDNFILNNEDVILKDINLDELTLERIINKNKGKVIYIDFWASWCAPCRALMPDSKRLSNKYKDKNITFIYISTDKSIKSWKRACLEEKLNNNSFISLNYPEASFYKDLKIKTIPRYLLYDKKGNLTLLNAPEPDSKEIRLLFDKYLKE